MDNEIVKNKRKKKRNQGKPFEARFAKDWLTTFPGSFLMRIPDQQSRYKNGSKNICDFICYVDGELFLMELKEHKGNTLGWAAFPQYERLLGYKGLKGVHPGLLIWFRDHDEVLYYKIEDLEQMHKDGKKSVNIKEKMLYNSIEIPSKKLRVLMESDYSVLRSLNGK